MKNFMKKKSEDDVGASATTQNDERNSQQAGYASEENSQEPRSPSGRSGLGFSLYKFKEKARISILEGRLASRQKKFGRSNAIVCWMYRNHSTAFATTMRYDVHSNPPSTTVSLSTHFFSYRRRLFDLGRRKTTTYRLEEMFEGCPC